MRLEYAIFARRVLRYGMPSAEVRRLLGCPPSAVLHPFHNDPSYDKDTYLTVNQIDSLETWLVGGSGLDVKQRAKLMKALRAEAARMVLESKL